MTKATIAAFSSPVKFIDFDREYSLKSWVEINRENAETGVVADGDELIAVTTLASCSSDPTMQVGNGAASEGSSFQNARTKSSVSTWPLL
ncbi:hypothetical protein L483_12440 [Pseudomonas putida H8234]|nr:hypothetical protein L483_12440 [Pseudomonas putida H8234]